MKQSADEWLEKVYNFRGGLYNSDIVTAKEKEENIQLEMVHKFAFDYTYNYKGDKTLYEYVDEWFKEYKRLEEKHKNK
jgi:hypothetical protein